MFFPSIPSLPSVPSLPSAPFFPSMPFLPSRPSFPLVPFLPSRPFFPSVPSFPSMPFLPSVPFLPSRPFFPSVPSFPLRPFLPLVPSFPSRPFFPSVPFIPFLPSDPSLPFSPTAPLSVSRATRSCHSSSAASLHWIAVPLFRTSGNTALLFSALLHTAANAMQSTMQTTRQSAVVIQYIRFFIYHCLLSNIVNGIYPQTGQHPVLRPPFGFLNNIHPQT